MTRLALIAAVAAVAIASPVFGAAQGAASRPALTISPVPPISGGMILPDAAPRAAGNVVEIVASRGEYEPASVVLRTAATGVSDVTMNVGDFIQPDTNARIPAANIDIRVVKVWFQGASAWNDISKSRPDDFRQILVPELLLHDDALVQVEPATGENRVRLSNKRKLRYEVVNQGRLATTEQVLPTASEFPVRDAAALQPFDVPARSTKQIWFTVYVPEAAAPGRYIAQVGLKSGNVDLGTVTLGLRVTSFVLDQPKVSYSVYYRAQLDDARASIGSEYRNHVQMLAELADMSAHGIGNPTVYQHQTDRLGLEGVLKLRQQAGLAPGDLYYLGVQTTESSLGRPQGFAEDKIRKMIPSISRLAAPYGYGQLYVYGRDEAKGDELTAQLSLWRTVHQSGGKVFVAGSADAYDRVGNDLDLLVSYGQPDQRQARLWHSTGKRIFSYQNPQSGPENPLLFRLNYGLLLWANDYDGAMIYAYQHCFGTCWNDVDHPVYRDHNLTYPTADGVIPTLAWEGVREAVDDVRYVTTLQSSIDASADKDSATVQAAVAYLQALRDRLKSLQGRTGKYNRDATIDLDQTRSTIISYIDALAAGEARKT